MALTGVLRVTAVWILMLAGTAAPGADPQSRAGVGAQTDVARSGIEPRARPVIQAPAAIRVGVAGQGTYAVRSIPIEEYVAGVLTGEAARDSEPAVLEALAVAIRTFALKNLNRHQADGFDVCDETHCQVLRRATAVTTVAADRTVGQVLTWNGALAIVYYSASCGGRTEIPSAVWPGAEDPPYLPSRSDDGCGGDPVWTAQLPTRDLERALRASGFRGSLKALRVLSRDGSGRVGRLAVDGLVPSSLSGQDLRMFVGPQLGWQLIKSTAFDLRRAPDGYQFSGRGYGHGVGMCVIGATRLAARGESADSLLRRYYPGTTIGTIAGNAAAAPARPVAAATASLPAVPSLPAVASPPVTSIPADPDEGAARARQDLERFAARARAELSASLEVTPAAAMPVRVHATGEAYERATGRPWFSFGALIGGELHLMPLDQLRQRGVLDRIVRREVIHSLIDGELSRRPRWVRDGAALYFAEPQGGETELRGLCPSDAELGQPLSAGALTQAYARARACFARQIASGRSWREVR